MAEESWVTTAGNAIGGAVGAATSAIGDVAGWIGKRAIDTTNAVNGITSEGTDTSGDISQSAYDFKYQVFPSDLGMDYYGHYMVFNINVPTEGLSYGMNFNAVAGPIGSDPRYVTPLNELSTVDTLRFGNITSPGVNGERTAIPRQTRRIKESIAIFMPAGLNFNTTNRYSDITLSEKVGAAISAVPIVGDLLGGVTGGLGSAAALAAQMGRRPINPAVEVLFETTALRTFQFSFLFCPKNEQESVNLESIIRTIRFHSAPEINPTSPIGIGAGMTWIPPAEFDIMFFNKGVENRHIPRINTCVLENIMLDYHPISSTAYATFTNGHPVAVMMILNFKEVEPIHKKRVTQGIY